METQNEGSNNTLYKSILQTAMDGFWLVDTKGQILEVNKAYCQMSGYSQQELLAMNIADLESIETKADTAARINRIAESGFDRFETIHRRKDGSKFDVEISVQYNPAENGRFVVFLRDITKHKNTEADLSKQKLLVEAVAETIPAIIYVFDLETNSNVFINPGIEQMLGYSKTEIHEMGENVLANIIHPQDLLAVLKLHEKILLANDDDLLTIEYRMKHRTGKWVHLHSTERVFMRNADGSVKQKIGVATDTSQEILIKESLKESEEKYKALYENAPLAYQSLNEDGTFRDVNPAWLETLGYERDEVIGKRYIDFLHPEWKKHFEKNFPEFKKRGYVHDVQFKIKHKNGSYIDIAFEGCVGYNPDGSFRQTYCVFQDITLQKQAEENLSKEKALLKTIIDYIPVMLTHYDPNSQMLYLNKEFEKVIGWTSEEVGGIDMMEKVYPDPEYRKKAFDYMQKASSEWREFQVHSKAGKIIDSEWSNIRLDDGSQIGIGIDITDQKTANEEIKKLNKQLLTTIESMTDAFVSLDTKWCYTYMNKNAASIFKREPKSMIGKHIWTEFPEGVGQPFYHACQKAMKEQKPQFLTEYYPPEAKWFENRIFPSPTGLSIFFADITEKKQNESEVLRHTQELKMLELLSREISGTLSLDEIIPAAVDSLMATVKPDMIFFFIRENNKLVLKDMSPKTAMANLGDFPDHLVGECMCGLAVSQNKSLYSKDINSDSRCTWQECKLAGIRSFAALPLKKGEESIGVIGLGSIEPHDFQAQSDFLETMVNSISLNIKNALLHDEVSRHSEELEQKVEERTKDLETKILEIQRMNNLFVGRELRMKELKDKIKALEGKKGNH